VQSSTGHVLAGNEKKRASANLARCALEEERTGDWTELKNMVGMPGFEKNTIGALQPSEDGCKFDANDKSSVRMKCNDKQVQVALNPGTKGACCLKKGRTTPKQEGGGQPVDESAHPPEAEVWLDVDQPINEEGKKVTSSTHSAPKSMDANKSHDVLGQKTCKHLQQDQGDWRAKST
jgi:hypothetical protein